MKANNEDRCPEHPEYDPYNLEIRKHFNRDCRTCARLFYGTERIGTFSGESEENGDGAENAKFRIGPLKKLEQYGKVRFLLGLYKEDVLGFRVDEKNMTVYVEGVIPANAIVDFLRLGCDIYERNWPKTSRLHIFLYACSESWQKFKSMLIDPPKKPFIETVVSNRY